MKHQLDFEKPILELQRKLEDLRKHPETHSMGISFEEEVSLIEKKIAETRRPVCCQFERMDTSANRATSVAPLYARLHGQHFQRLFRTARRPTVCR